MSTGSHGMAAGGASDVTVRYERAAQGMQALGSAFGGVLFLLAAVVFAGLMVAGQVPFPFGLPIPIVFGFFGLLMASGAVSSIRKGRARIVLELGPSGIWMPDMGKVPWSEIAEVRLERRPLLGVTTPSAAGAGGRLLYTRIGVVPRDRRVRDRARHDLHGAMIRAYVGIVRSIAPQAALGHATLAPFNINAEDVTVPLAEIADRIDPFLAVRREPARGWTMPAEEGAPSAVPEQPLADADLTRLDALLGTTTTAAAGGLGSVLPSLVPPLTAGSAPTPAAPAPSAASVFAAPPGQIELHRASGRGRLVTGQVVSDFAWSGMSLVFGIVFWFVFLAADIELEIFLFSVPFLLIPVAFFLIGLPGVLAAPRRLASVRGDSLLLRAGPEGIWLPELGGLPWEAIGEIRVEDYMIIRQRGSRDTGRRLRLGIVPRDARVAARRGWAIRAHDAYLALVRRIPGFRSRPAPAPFNVDLALVDAEPDEVVEGVRRYHPVTWTGE
jgi:hypothetical protein